MSDHDEKLEQAAFDFVRQNKHNQELGKQHYFKAGAAYAYANPKLVAPDEWVKVRERVSDEHYLERPELHGVSNLYSLQRGFNAACENIAWPQQAKIAELEKRVKELTDALVEGDDAYEKNITAANEKAKALASALETIACAQKQDVIRNECPAVMIDGGYVEEATRALSQYRAAKGKE